MEGSIYLRHDYCGTIGTGSTSTRRTISHECAHWLNIRHVWGNSNNALDAGNCSSDDLVTDTPNTLGNNGCNLSGQSCGSLDNVQNIMDYTGSCRRMFTQGQVARMHTALNNSTAQRNNLWTAANLTATGTNGPGDLCVTDFSSTARIICEGESVTFSDNSYHSVTSRNWAFTGGSPASSTAESPMITYNNAGVYSVSLDVSDGSSILNETKLEYIVVIDNPGVTLPYIENFESLTTIPDNNSWFILNENGGSTWGLESVGAGNSQKSASIMNFGTNDGSTNEIHSETIDLSVVDPNDQIIFNFETAYKKRTSSNNEKLQLYISKDCGETWVLRKNITGASLGEAVQQSPYFPISPEEWAYHEVTNINPDYYVSNFRFKFVFANDGGNNIYLDNINFYPASMVELTETELNADSYALFPNPASSEVSLKIKQSASEKLEISLINSLGKEIRNLSNDLFEEGYHELKIDLEGLKTGFYFIKVSSNDKVNFIKLLKE